ncbi:hypothetical protein V1J52_03740 [Streptomyces sp. TRM 70351]|uniref:hypothetical protein n=1 Tax=Streptomyces sp. TRM 70351 TaxID=3116552 RepID=UPI002E7BBD45|nr:hypothetical protein [Streptomyces sp. TRM 70351]MEE1927300.1 hypothetical protein [Streptomyces sp. TRM 70351]
MHQHHEDAHDRARTALARLLAAAGHGRHHLVCSVTPTGRAGPPLAAAVHAEQGTGPLSGPRYPRTAGHLFTTVLAAALTTGLPGGVVLRTTRGGRDTVRAWRLHDGWLHPLTEAEVFTAYCTDPLTGEPVPPEPGVDYRPGLHLPAP